MISEPFFSSNVRGRVSADRLTEHNWLVTVREYSFSTVIQKRAGEDVHDYSVSNSATLIVPTTILTWLNKQLLNNSVLFSLRHKAEPFSSPVPSPRPRKDKQTCISIGPGHWSSPTRKRYRKNVESAVTRHQMLWSIPHWSSQLARRRHHCAHQHPQTPLHNEARALIHPGPPHWPIRYYTSRLSLWRRRRRWLTGSLQRMDSDVYSNVRFFIIFLWLWTNKI